MDPSPSPTVGIPEAELDGDVGRPDVAVMTEIRNLYLAEEPLVANYSWNDQVDRRELRVHLSDGIGDADRSRLDVTWYTAGAYKFHYVDESGRNWRFDRHPNDHFEEKHFHEPPDADSRTAVPSCISVEELELVARAVLKLWRRGVATDSFDELNTARNPP